jgi:hypothetical protein
MSRSPETPIFGRFFFHVLNRLYLRWAFDWYYTPIENRSWEVGFFWAGSWAFWGSIKQIPAHMTTLGAHETLQKISGLNCPRRPGNTRKFVGLATVARGQPARQTGRLAAHHDPKAHAIALRHTKPQSLFVATPSFFEHPHLDTKAKRVTYLGIKCRCKCRCYEIRPATCIRFDRDLLVCTNALFLGGEK